MKSKEQALSGNPSFITIEGVIGAGKTSLSERLAERWNGRLILETVEDNPFLSKFYQDRKAYAFQAQIWFLLSRYRQLSESVLQQDLFHRVTISDYMFAKDRIFATVNLDDDELQLYNHVAAILEKQAPQPDAVVYLQASTQVLLKRIAKRGRPYEAAMDHSYLSLVNEAYNHFFFHYDQSPLLVINTDDLDFVQSENDLDELVEQIEKLRPGKNYYQPPGLKDRAALKGRWHSPGT
ncbi:MAG: deoxynucleoside kinase [Chitinispirillaceae bacterium]|nr:deoxynucleoside kinase [Chitinispirillaceae bacterium]